jgi:Protein of unknown function (DUF1580)
LEPTLTRLPDDSAIANSALIRTAIDPSIDTLIPLKLVSKLVPGRTGKGIALTTVFRWAFRGCRGAKLQTILVGGQRYTTQLALDRFIAAINQSDSAHPISAITHEQQRRVEAALDFEGL